MPCFRIGDPKGQFPIFSGDGAALFEGRWNSTGQKVVYASQTYCTAMLEVLAHANGLLPPNQHAIEITIPAGTTYEIVTKDSLPGWVDEPVARAFGSRWFIEQRSAILIVPSYVAREERNVVISATHPQFPTLKAGLEAPVWWDGRLYRR
jgi:RES domain-containing protein